MYSLKSLVVLFIILGTCCAQQDVATGRKGHFYKHKFHHLYHNPYFYYLAFLVIKLKFAFVIGSMIMFALFASKTYALLKYGILQKNNKETEKIYIQPPEHHDHYPSYFSADDHANDLTSAGYERGFASNNMNLIGDIVKKFDINEMVFNNLNITDTACKQRFVCEADVKAKKDTLLNVVLFFIRDNSFLKYRTQETITSLEDCAKLCA